MTPPPPPKSSEPPPPKKKNKNKLKFKIFNPKNSQSLCMKISEYPPPPPPHTHTQGDKRTDGSNPSSQI